MWIAGDVEWWTFYLELSEIEALKLLHEIVVPVLEVMRLKVSRVIARKIRNVLRRRVDVVFDVHNQLVF